MKEDIKMNIIIENDRIEKDKAEEMNVNLMTKCTAKEEINTTDTSMKTGNTEIITMKKKDTILFQIVENNTEKIMTYPRKKKDLRGDRILSKETI